MSDLPAPLVDGEGPPTAPPSAPREQTWPAPRRIWPTLTALALLIPALLVSSAVALVLALATSGPGLEALADPRRLQAWLAALSRTPGGLALLALPSQLVLLALALLPAALSPTPLASRLGLCRPRIEGWLVGLLVVGTIGLTLPIDLLVGALFSQPSKQLLELVSAIRAPRGAAAALPYLLVGILPGVAEELFFRGYAQTRLLTRWPPVLALGLPALLFALVHADPMHIVTTLVPAAWLAWVAYESGSVWTSVLCHAGNNCFSVLMARNSADPFASTAQLDPGLLTLLGLTTATTLVSAWLLSPSSFLSRRRAS